MADNDEEGPSSPLPQEPDIDLSLFSELKSTKTLKTHNFALNSAPSNFLYSIGLHNHYSKKPDIEVHLGADKTGPVLGVVRLQIQGIKIGIGDPDYILPEGGGDVGDRMVWEVMERLNKWKYNEYSFDYESLRKERKTYTWRRTKAFWGHMREMELREGAKDDKEGELLAVWRRSEKVNKKRGSLFCKRFGQDEKWDLVVVLSILAIIESEVRRG
ncbi:hypothetical protein BDZ45DRAFT_808492 [Acephala macrosclerotiorum]|nr:hypothetical protein BDZ45DRAFT_808492 [Acephala macrosclerotiorum]